LCGAFVGAALGGQVIVCEMLMLASQRAASRK